MDKAKEIQDFYASKVKNACRPEIRRYSALQMAFFKAKRSGEDISVLKQELENARREAMIKAIGCLDEHEHFEVLATLSDNGKIRSMPDFFQELYYLIKVNFMQDGKNYGAADTPRCALGGSRERSSLSQRAALPSCEVKNYEDFLKTKQKRASFKSIEISRDELNGAMFDYQKDLVYLALKKGHFAIFAMTGSGKTAMQGEWAYQIWLKERAPVLIVTPLAVAFQSIEEIKHILGYDVKFCESADDVINGLNITNYEKLDKFDPDAFVALVLDESSRLKSYTSATRNLIIENYKHTPYKLACSATPSPNDYTELGNHTEFLNVMSLSEMLSMYFVHDGGDTSEWILKGHAVKPFWKFISSWAVFFTKPSDLGYSAEEDAKFKLPPLKMQHVEVESQSKDSLFAIAAQTLQERRQAKKDSLEQRCEKVAEICNESNENFLIWCELNDEGAMLKKLVADSVEIKGSDSDDFKARAMSDFANGKIKCLITKPKIAGFGMNWQKHCANVIYASLSDSFEGFFQSLRRVYRYGQTREVTCYIITSEAEANVLANIHRKEAEFYKMIEGCLEQTRELVLSEIKRVSREKSEYNPGVAMSLPEFLKAV